MLKLKADNGKKAIYLGVQVGGCPHGAGARISIAQASRDLEVQENLLRKWVRLYEADSAHALHEQGH